MTIAFNLSQLANYVNSSGLLDASTGLINSITVSNGGTGRTTQTAYAVICGGATTTAAQQSIASVGTAGQILTSNGAGALPTFQAPPSAGVTSLAAGTGISVSASTGAVTVSALSYSFNSVGSYAMGKINNGSASSGGNYSAGAGGQQITSGATNENISYSSNNLSGTWKWMGANTGGDEVNSVVYRVA
jgi:hypothetical protein